ncbi:MAG: DUF4435 domain-containing protein [Ruminococcus sp.]|jgi:hypothetical protein|nr:DUF4435 domain-containing protein [Ruminococcus sp.]
MGNNSVKSAQGIYDYITEIMLSRNTPKKPDILVVEGKEDEIFFKKFCKDTVYFVIANGKPNLVKALLEFPESKPYKKYIIGVCDRDYDEPLQNEQLFYYDFCNLEMMMCANTNSQTELQKNVPENVDLCTILEELLPRSCLRRLNTKLNLFLKLSKYGLKEYHFDYMNSPAAAIDNQCKIFSLSTRLNNADYESLDKEMKKSYSVSDLLCITQGHDFLAIYGFYVSRKIGRDINSDTVFEMLLDAFGEPEFRSTELYKKISVYSKTYGLKFFTC